MAVTLSDRAALGADATFQGQVRMAALSYATTAIRVAKTANNRADEKNYGRHSTNGDRCKCDCGHSNGVAVLGWRYSFGLGVTQWQP